MTTIMIVGLILMIARLSMRIGFVLVLIWGVVRLIDRWRFAPAPVAAVAAPSVPAVVAETPSTPVSTLETTEVKE